MAFRSSRGGIDQASSCFGEVEPAQTIARRQVNQLQATKKPGKPGFSVEQIVELAPDWHRTYFIMLSMASTATWDSVLPNSWA
jgi:hypothetical protein